MADAPVCRKCGATHWRFNACSSVSTKPTVPLFIKYQPREGFIDRADRIDQATVRMGETTFARRRQPGERHGALRAPEAA